MAETELDSLSQLAEDSTAFLKQLRDNISSERASLWVKGVESPESHADEGINALFPLNYKVLDSALAHGNGMVAFEQAAADQMSATGTMEMTSIRPCLAAAVCDENGDVLLGLLLDRKNTGGCYDEEELAFLQQVADMLWARKNS